MQVTDSQPRFKTQQILEMSVTGTKETLGARIFQVAKMLAQHRFPFVGQAKS
jgi:hypothetical protein